MLLNFTGGVGTASYHEHELASYSLVEQLWARYYSSFGNLTIATGILSFLLHEGVYFGRFIPWYIISKIPWFQKWKLQESKSISDKEQFRCACVVLALHFTIELPLIMMFHPIAEMIGLETWQLPFPPWRSMVTQIAFCFIIEDAWHYCFHRALHWGPLYRNIHKMHHKYSAPFGLAAEYAHPLEIIFVGIGTICGPLVYCLFTGSFHLVTVYIWITMRLLQVIDAHSGYDFPWSLHNVIPFWGGADFHDFHHMAFTNNYSSSFRIWDWIFGTDQKYQEFRREHSTKEATVERKAQ